MPIKIEVPDSFFKKEEKDKLMVLLGSANEQEFANALGRIILAALDEYREMLLGMGLPSRASEIREFRLYHLIKRFFGGRIPDELEVSSMFQLPEARSKNLILYVLTRFRYDLDGEILNTLRQIAREAEIISETGEYRVYTGSQNMVEELDRIISRAGVRYKRLAKSRTESNLYLIAPDSFDVVCKYLGIKKK